MTIKIFKESESPQHKELFNDDIDTLLEKYNRVRVTYADKAVKTFTLEKWVIFREGIKINLFDRGGIKIKGVNGRWYRFTDWFRDVAHESYKRNTGSYKGVTPSMLSIVWRLPVYWLRSFFSALWYLRPVVFKQRAKRKLYRIMLKDGQKKWSSIEFLKALSKDEAKEILTKTIKK